MSEVPLYHCQEFLKLDGTVLVQVSLLHESLHLSRPQRIIPQDLGPAGNIICLLRFRTLLDGTEGGTPIHLVIEPFVETFL